MFSLKLFLIAFILPTIIASRRSHKADFSSDRVTSSKSRTSSTMKCPSKCKCDARRKEVKCTYKSLKGFPRDIPTSTKRLVLSGNKMKRISQKSLSSLPRLEVLELNGNYLESINNRMFRKLKKLKRLNLSFNKLNNIPSQTFKNLKNLKILHLRGNNLGKLPLDVFAGLNKTKEIDISANSLQTLELNMFEELSSLKSLFLDKNQWHCDCSLKEAQEGLEKRGVDTGFIICDSPKLYAGRHLGGLSVNSFCGTKAESLAYIVLGTVSGIISILFVVFMCRRRIPSNVDLAETRKIISGKSKTECLEDALSRSSLVYDSENDSSLSSPEKPIDLLQISQDLKAEVLPLTDDAIKDRPHSVPPEPTSVLPTFQLKVHSYPNLATCSEKIDKFNDD